jgi:BASS family bile acid:Na+ symporter
MPIDAVVRVLTSLALIGLLLETGLRVTAGEVATALVRCRLWVVLPLEFVLAPLVTLALVRLLHVPPEDAAGMLLLAAAPFAPVVPVFVKLARGDLALAAGLTALVPPLSAFLTPPVCVLALAFVPGAGPLRVDVARLLAVLFVTITAPLCLGVALHHHAPRLRRRLLRPLEVVSEGVGALSLAVVVAAELPAIVGARGATLAAMLGAGALSFALGHLLGGPGREARRVIALGTGNRNIALALLLALESPGGARVVPAVATYGLLLILLGLLHVGAWRAAGGPAGRGPSQGT